MGNDEIEEFSSGSEEAFARPQSEGEATGRMAPVAKAVAIPSVVSGNKAENVSLSGTSESNEGVRIAPSDDSSATRPLGSDDADFDTQTGKNEESLKSSTASSPAPQDTAALEALASLDADAKTGQLENLEGEASTSARVKGEADYKKQALESLSSSNISGPISGGLSGNSANLNELSAEGIERRKEQIQRAKKRAVDQRKKRTTRIVRRIVFAVITLLILAAVTVFSVHRWGIHDDNADLQGTWQIDGTNAKVTIKNGMIRLNREVAYNYALDPTAKTLTFDFGQLEGQGRYRFSIDRNKISILDGPFESTDTLSEDIPWTLQAFWDFLATRGIKSPDLGEGSVTLSRVVEE